MVGWQAHPEFPLVVAANRDEFHQRPTANLSSWPEDSHLIAGRDLEAGGTWLGIHRSGRFAAVTNVREPGVSKGKITRGALTQRFLQGAMSARAYAKSLVKDDYAGYNLLLCDGENLVYCTNRHGSVETLSPGMYGMSNHRLDTPWPKLVTATRCFGGHLSVLPSKEGREALFAMLQDDLTVDDAFLPETGVSLEWERRLSAIFIRSPEYGTRASTLVAMNQAREFDIEERSFDALGECHQISRISTGV